MGKFVALLVLVLLVAAAWSGGWLWAAGEIRSTIASLADGDGEAEPKVTCGALDVAGFPFRFDVACTEATIVSADVTTTIAGLKATLLAYNPTQAKLSALSPATIADAYSGAQSRVEFAGAEGSARLISADFWKGLQGEGWRIGRVSVLADDVKWLDTLVGDVVMLSAGHIEAHLVDVPERHDPAAGTSVLAGYTTASDAAVPGMQVAGGEGSIEVELSGLPDDLRAFNDSGVLCRVREAGGELKLVSLKGTAGEDFVESSGAVGLDGSGKPDGQISLKSRGLVERVGALLPEELKFAFGPQAEDGSYSQTVTIRAGLVLVGLLPLPLMLAPLANC